MKKIVVIIVFLFLSYNISILNFRESKGYNLQFFDICVWDIWIDPEQFHRKENVTICILITNLGFENAPPRQGVIYFDVFPIARFYLPWIAAGKSLTIKMPFRWPNDLHYHVVGVEVDTTEEPYWLWENNFLEETFKAINAPPIPHIVGSQYGIPNISYEYTIWGTDLEGDAIRYIIDWGDGTSDSTDFYSPGEKLKLTHKWATSGIYTLTVKAIDFYEAINTTFFKVIIDGETPQITLISPTNGLYLFNKKIFNTPKTIAIIFGKISVIVDAVDKLSGIATISFYIDNTLKYVDKDEPYKWTWNEKAIGKHEIKVIAHDYCKNFMAVTQKVWIINYGLT